MSDENPKPDPKVIRVKTLWEGGLRANTLIRGFEVHSDDPLREWGTNTAPSSSEIFLSTLASCLTSSYAWIALTSRIHHTAITTSATGTIEVVDGKRKISQIELKLKAVAIEGTPEKLERIFEKAHSTCLIVNSVGIDIKANFEYKIEDE